MEGWEEGSTQSPPSLRRPETESHPMERADMGRQTWLPVSGTAHSSPVTILRGVPGLTGFQITPRIPESRIGGVNSLFGSTAHSSRLCTEYPVSIRPVRDPPCRRPGPAAQRGQPSQASRLRIPSPESEREQGRVGSDGDEICEGHTFSAQPILWSMGVTSYKVISGAVIPGEIQGELLVTSPTNR